MACSLALGGSKFGSSLGNLAPSLLYCSFSSRLISKPFNCKLFSTSMSFFTPSPAKNLRSG